MSTSCPALFPPVAVLMLMLGWAAPAGAQNGADLDSADPSILPRAQADTSRTSFNRESPCRTNAVVILRSKRSFTNRCPGVRYVVGKPYLDRLLTGYAAGRDALPMVEEALADRDSLIAELRRKEALLDSTNQALIELSGALSGESLRALSAASDSLNTAILPELRAARDELSTASDDLRAAKRGLVWSRLKRATLPALAGIAVGFLLGR